MPLTGGMSKIARDPLYRRHRFPAEIIAHAVWLYFRFPLSLRMVEDMLAARGIIVTHQTIRTWAEKFGRHFANEVRRRSAGRLGDKWHLDEVVVAFLSGCPSCASKSARLSRNAYTGSRWLRSRRTVRRQRFACLRGSSASASKPRICSFMSSYPATCGIGEPSRVMPASPERRTKAVGVAARRGLACAGSARLRRGMIPLAWRFLLFQKDSV